MINEEGVQEQTTEGIWVGKGEASIFNEFDEYFEPRTRAGQKYSRGRRIKEAMQVYQAVHEAYRDDPELPDPDAMDMREFLASIRTEIALTDSEKRG